METTRAPYVPEKYTSIAWFNADQRQLAEAMLEHLKSFYVVCDHWPRLATMDEVKDKLDNASCSSELVIVIAAHARQYTTSMQAVSNAREDFLSGWRAHEKIVKARERAAEEAREEAEAAKPKFAIYDSKYGEYAVIENDCYSRSTSWASNATMWKTKRSAEKARVKHCGTRWTVVDVREKV